MMLGPKGLLPPTDATDCSVALQLSQSYKHSNSAEMLIKQAFRYFLMFGRVPRSKSRLCKHDSILYLLTLASFNNKFKKCRKTIKKYINRFIKIFIMLTFRISNIEINNIFHIFAVTSTM